MVQVLAPFTLLFSKRVFKHAQVLLMGAILAPGRRTVSSALRAIGLDQEKRFHRYHRVLSRALWSSLKGERLPNLSEVAEDTSTPWGSVTVANWYDSEDRTVKIASEKAVWYSTGLFAVPIRWVLIRDPERVQNPGPPLYRPQSQSGADSKLVGDALAA
jgi:hypothetical protein